MKALSLTLSVISCLLANSEALNMFPELAGPCRQYSNSSDVGRCSSIGVHQMESRAKILDHAHFWLKTTPIFALTMLLALTACIRLDCINEEMNGKSSRAYFVM